MLDRFLSQYSLIFNFIDKEEIDENDLKVLEELQCKANEIN